MPSSYVHYTHPALLPNATNLNLLHGKLFFLRTPPKKQHLHLLTSKSESAPFPVQAPDGFSKKRPELRFAFLPKFFFADLSNIRRQNIVHIRILFSQFKNFFYIMIMIGHGLQIQLYFFSDQTLVSPLCNNQTENMVFQFHRKPTV